MNHATQGSVVPVILSGGSGTRLWPLSRRERPKQLASLVGDETMLQATLTRLDGIEDLTDPIVVCNEVHGDEIVKQLDEIGVTPAAVLMEPAGRNTAPAVAAAASVADPDDVLVVLPADHLIDDPDALRVAVAVAVDAAHSGNLVTFGVTPTRPETGFGYIETGDEIAPSPAGPVRRVRRFVEKPDAATAAAYVADGAHVWNSGMFAFAAGTYLGELERFEPGMAGCCDEAVRTGIGAAPLLRLDDEFLACGSISVDYAVMERTERAAVVPLDAGWSDLGSWTAMWEVATPDGDGNVLVGDVIAIESSGSYVRSEGRLVAVVGVEGLVVVETADAVLVTTLEEAQGVKGIVEALQDVDRPEATRSPRSEE